MTPQHKAELEKIARRIVVARNVRAYLEVGARNGISLAIIGEAMRRGGVIVAVDLVAGPWGTPGSGRSLRAVAADLRVCRGHRVELVFGDSRCPQTRDTVWRLAKECPRVARGANRPFDLVFIDADHTYEGVSGDWLFYGQMGRIVVFDDIARSAEAEKWHDDKKLRFGVATLWNELKTAANGDWWTCEIMEEGSNNGKGVLTWR
jgi:predicted O-methyltransferase YrrM